MTRLRVGQMGPSEQVYDAGGQKIDLKSCWADGPIVLTFLRHFG